MFTSYYFRNFLMVFHPQRHQHGLWKLSSPISSVSVSCDQLITLILEAVLRSLQSTTGRNLKSPLALISFCHWPPSQYIFYTAVRFIFLIALVQTHLLATCNKSPPCGRLIRLFAAHPELLIGWFLLGLYP